MKKFDDVTLRLLWSAELALLACQVTGLTGAVSPLFALTFVLLAVYWVCLAVRQMPRLTWLAAALIALAVFHVLLNALVTSTAVSFAYLRKPMMFAAGVVSVLVGATGTVGCQTGRFLRFGNTALAVVLSLAHAVRYSGEEGFLTLGFSNPNTTGMFLAAVFGLELVSLRGSEAWWSRLCHLLTAVYLGYLTAETGARSAMLALAVETGFFLWSLIRRRRPLRLSPVFCQLAAVLPLFFALIYLVLLDNQQVTGMLEFLAGEGKPLTSRAEIWQEALSHIRKSPLLGAYSQLGASFQMHNSHLDILASYGLPVLVLTCLFLFCALRLRGENLSSEGLCAMGGCCALLLMGVGEAALFSGGLGICLFAGVFLLLAGEDRQEKGVEK